MEKSRSRTTPVLRCGLLIILSFVTLFSVSATNVDFFVSSFEFLQGEPLKVELVVQETDPTTATLNVIGIPEQFILTQSRKERRFRDTVFTVEWIVMDFGEFSLGPFLLSVGEETIEMPMIHLVVGPPPISDTTQVRWIIDEGLPRVGEKKSIALEALFSGTINSIQCPVPENALLEESHSTELKSAKGWTIIGQWYWTPLIEGRQALPSALAEFSMGKKDVRTIASIPLIVTVAPAPISNKEKEISGSLLRAFTDLPQLEQEKEYEMDRVSIMRIAELRHAEYVSFFPSRIRKERQQLEATLSLRNTAKVPYASWKSISVIGSVVLILVWLLSHILSNKRQFLKYISRITAFCTLLFIIGALFIYSSDRLDSGVVLSNQIRHVPENASSIISEIIPGSSVKILKRAGDWVYVETTDHVRGWLQSNLIIEYTTDSPSGNFESGAIR